MKNIISSASKLVLLYLIAILGLLAVLAGFYGVTEGIENETTKALIGAFTSAVTFVLGFYFGSKGEPSQPYAGK